MALDNARHVAGDLSAATLLIVGEGPERANLQRRASRTRVEGPRQFRRAVTQSALSLYYSAAMCYCSPREAEGWRTWCWSRWLRPAGGGRRA
jgi:hypothetical protein